MTNPNPWANDTPAPPEPRQDPGLADKTVGLDPAAYAASGAYFEWVNAGRPWTPAQPIAALTATLRRYGYTVYILGDDSHETAVPPEDHTPFSATGWPVASPRWFVHALDIMPPAAGSGLPDLAQLGSQLALDKNTGVAGAQPIKYMNWTPRGGSCRHESWEPSHAVTGSSDAGHIHLSIRSDCTHSTAMDAYDPVARFRAGGQPTPPAPHPVPHPNAPVWPGIYLRLTTPMMHNDATRTWQQKMHDRGWGIAVDGWYGPKSDGICRQFQAEKRLGVDGIVGPVTWSATWTLPVT